MHKSVQCILIEISETKDGKKNKDSYLSCVTNGEFYFSTKIVEMIQLLIY